jgi:hypothetical protein
MIWGALAVMLVAPQAPPPTPQTSSGPQVEGQVSVLVDAVPKQDAVEARPRLRLDLSGDAGSRRQFRYRFEAALDMLAAGRGGAAADAGLNVRDGWVEFAGERVDVRLGFGRLVWGRLDEIAPSDVINPLDTARFFLEGRSEARRAVTFVRGRLFLSDAVHLEGVLVPRFRRGTFDAMEEETSPFNLVNDLILPAAGPVTPRITHLEPSTSWSTLSGGARMSATAGRVDFSASAYRGYDGFGIVTFEPFFEIAIGPAVLGRLVERYPRFTMIAGDVETARGEWAVRAEVAAFVEKGFQGMSVPGSVSGRAVDAGGGFDRKAGEFRVYGTVLFHRQWSDEDPLVARTDVNLVASIERQLRRDRWLIRGFGVANPADGSAFLRGVVQWKARDNFTMEGSGGLFAGTSDDTIGRFKGRDFLYARATVFF